MWFSTFEKQPDFSRSQKLRLDGFFQKLLTLILLHQVLDVGNLSIRTSAGLAHPPPVHRALLLGE